MTFVLVSNLLFFLKKKKRKTKQKRYQEEEILTEKMLSSLVNDLSNRKLKLFHIDKCIFSVHDVIMVTNINNSIHMDGKRI